CFTPEHNLQAHFKALKLSRSTVLLLIKAHRKQKMEHRIAGLWLWLARAQPKALWYPRKNQLAEGQRIQYNFVKPHMAMEGKTPAQAGGLKVRGWSELLKSAVSSSNQ